MKTKKLLASAVLASTGLLAAGAQAAMVAAWDFETDGGFVVGAGSCSNGGEAACNLEYSSGITPSGIPDTASIMTWGVPSILSDNDEKSGLQGIFGTTGEGPFDAQLLSSGPVPIPMFEQLLTNGDWENTGAAVHYNNVISIDGGYMDASVLRTSFALTAPEMIGPVSTDIDITFNETPNSGTCPAGNPHGTICDDLFTLSALPPPIEFTFDGFKYTVSFRYQDGPGSIVDGNQIWTAELAPGTAVMFTQARITAVPIAVPVPGVLALMGMGLVMLGWRTRGRKVA